MLLAGYVCVASLSMLAALLAFTAALVHKARRGLRVGVQPHTGGLGRSRGTRVAPAVVPRSTATGPAAARLLRCA